MQRLLLLMLAPLIILAGCGDKDTPPAGSGMIEATEIVVSSEAAGRVLALHFDEGDEIAPGDTLVELDDRKLRLQLESARAGRKVAEARLAAARLEAKNASANEAFTSKELTRVQQLVASNTATGRQLDEIEHRHTSAQIAVQAAKASIHTLEAELSRIDAEIAILRDQIDDAHPTAPAVGTISEKYVDHGELLGPGSPIARIAQLDTVWVKVYLSMHDFAKIRIGDRATVDTEAGSSYDGVVTWTADEAEFTPKNVQTKKARADLVYAVKIHIPNTDRQLKVGQPVYVTVTK